MAWILSFENVSVHFIGKQLHPSFQIKNVLFCVRFTLQYFLQLEIPIMGGLHTSPVLPQRELS